MRFLIYLKDRFLFIIFTLLIVLLHIGLFLALDVSYYAIFLIATLYILCNFLYLFIEYKNTYRYIDNLRDQIDLLEEKYLLSEMIDAPNSKESNEFYKILKECNKSMNDRISEIELKNKEYREYIELWVHEVKTPIASTKLIIENNPSPVTDIILGEINKVDDYIEQTLFYTRLNSVEKDYIIKILNLEEEVNAAIRKNSRYLIQRKVKIVKSKLRKEVFSDTKWLQFILNQIISNSIKYYHKKENILEFSAEEINGEVILNISDNGIGMNEKTLIKAFEKGYTGENGRKFKESTGIGLYLCKNLCDKLGLSITLSSKEGEGTKVSILFPKNKMLLLEN